jgi:hypothetical protein
VRKLLYTPISLVAEVPSNKLSLLVRLRNLPAHQPLLGMVAAGILASSSLHPCSEVPHGREKTSSISSCINPGDQISLPPLASYPAASPSTLCTTYG